MNVVTAKQFAREWVDYWNSADIDLIMSHYAEDIAMHSPLIRDLMGVPNGVIKGAEQLKAYFLRGLEKYPQGKFKLQQVFLGVNSITILFFGATGELVSETLFFNEEGKIDRMYAQYLVS